VAEAASAGAGGLEAQRWQAAQGYLRAPSRPTTNHVGNAMAEAAVDLVLAELEGGPAGEEGQQAAKALPAAGAAAGGGGAQLGERPSRARMLLLGGLAGGAAGGAGAAGVAGVQQ
jgi:hypothetical protein